ncbi:hypothetical protein [Microbaculum marinisediminis]|uniref:Uncharacterized protein n=1 Tax=Microbaculum marinisediminis TaxID=2931392 RepID=A0AAW5QW75_9HYPH|nr:hypothetical protein [Microbaculum sp. A6E488]MCT8971407.1 hypothetical protein [Microbaculum sp. A6E488]
MTMNPNERTDAGPLVYHPTIGARVRAGDYADHAASSYALAEIALGEGRGTDAAELARYTVTEALEAYELFTAWCDEIPDFIAGRGIPAETLAAETKRLRELWDGASGDAFDAAAGWDRYRALIETFATAAAAGGGDPRMLDEAREIWRDTHDRLCDGVYFWVDAAARLLGEEITGELWDVLMQPMYDYYVRYDIDNHPWPRSFDLLMHYAFEGIRGHLTGPGRSGALEIEEEEDRWAIRFDPCGSGGRTMRDDPDTGGGPRMEAPWNLGVTQKEYDWSWNKKGVCLYCVHCCQLNERMPIRRFGYPTRVVEPPVWPASRKGGKCTWYVYKDPALVPDEIYARVGATPPQRLGGRAQAEQEGGR